MMLEHVRRFRIEADLIHETVEEIRSVGLDGFELFVLWLGRVDGDIFVVDTAHVPRQTSHVFESGLCVTINGDELRELGLWLYKSQLIIGAQVHSHPTEAYHSETDDSYPMATIEGSLSVVLPYFGRDGWESDGIAAYRLEDGVWRDVTGQVDDLIEVIPHGTG